LNQADLRGSVVAQKACDSELPSDGVSFGILALATANFYLFEGMGKNSLLLQQ